MEDIIKQILAKESLSDSDINILMKNKDLLDQDTLVRLGLATAPVVKEPVEVAEPKLEEAPKPIKAKRAKK